MKERKANIELLRIVSMLLIIAHHYVVNSGLLGGGPITQNPYAFKSIFLLCYGAFGKVCINCFVLITGFFMCKSDITIRKFMKLLLEVMFYKIVINTIFWVSGYEPFTFRSLFYGLLPITKISTGFVSAFFIFFLSIPFLNTLIRNLSQKMHLQLIALCTFTYVFLGTFKPWFGITMNYVSWFIVLYFMSSYIALYPNRIFDNTKLWAIATILSVLISIFTIIGCRFLWHGSNPYLYVTDSNTALAVTTSVSAFLLFKNLSIHRFTTAINKVAASTFGVLLIHANSDTMRRWLWKTVCDNIGAYYTRWWFLHAMVVPLLVFTICIMIDMLRIRFIERPFFIAWEKVYTKFTTERTMIH